MPSSSQKTRHLVLAFGLLATALVLLWIYAGGQWGPTFRFVNSW